VELRIVNHVHHGHKRRQGLCGTVFGEALRQDELH